MLELVVVDDMLTPNALVTIRHTETDQVGRLTWRTVSPPLTAEANEEPGLRPGHVRHKRLELQYCLNGIVYWAATQELGVWYTALYVAEDRKGPHWFRPLRTTDNKGWLDPDRGESPRFERVG